MATRSKRYRKEAEQVSETPLSLDQAIDKVKSFKGVKFDQTVECVVQLGRPSRPTSWCGSLSLPGRQAEGYRVLRRVGFLYRWGRGPGEESHRWLGRPAKPHFAEGHGQGRQAGAILGQSKMPLAEEQHGDGRYRHGMAGSRPVGGFATTPGADTRWSANRVSRQKLLKREAFLAHPE
jgi:hypothetical protein